MSAPAARARALFRDMLRSLILRWREDRPSRELWLLAAILAIAALLRLVWVLYAMHAPQGFHDPTFYFFYARQIADGHGYRTPDGSPTAYYPIGYSATLGAVFALVRHTAIPDNLPDAAGVFQLLLGVATVGLVYEVGRRLFSAGVALLAALWIALFPNLIYHTATYLSETLFNTVIMAALAVLLWSDWRRRRLGWVRLTVFGVLLGYSVLVRPISLVFVPLLLVVWLIAGFGWRRSFAYTGVVAVTTVAVILPWTVRNVIVMEAPVIISTNLGDNLCIGHYQGARGGFALPAVCINDADYVGVERPESEVRRDHDNTRKAIDFAVHNPRAELKLLSRKAYSTWDHDHDGLWAAESYHDNPFIGSRFSLQVAPADVPDERLPQVALELADLTGLAPDDITAAVATGRTGADPSAPVVLMTDLEVEIATAVRDAGLPGVRLVIPRSMLRQTLERVADIYFFITISLAGLGLAGFLLRPADPRRWFFLLALLWFAGSSLPFFGDARFHVPAVPLLTISAAWAVLAARHLPRLLVAPSAAPPSASSASAAVERAEGERPVSEQDAL